jgi:multidrug efflux pump subunit AcrA (membrane-fusion protein)
MKHAVMLALMISLNTWAQSGHQHGAPPVSKSAPSPKMAEPRNEEPRVPVVVPMEQQSKMGLKVVRAGKRKVDHTIRTVGTVTADQTKEAHVHTRINGWIEDVYANYVGKELKKRQPLFSLYSPDLVSTQEEYLSARGQDGAGQEISNAALQRLRLWNVPDSEILKLTQSGKARRALTFESPVNGVIVSKTAVNGMYITPEMELYYIADLSKVWIIVTLYEYDLASIAVGDESVIQLPYDANRTLKGKISYIYPEVEMETRTAKARIEMPNPEQKLKPGMFANVELKKNLGNAIVIPDDAVIDTGVRRIVFVRVENSKFEPREVKIGARVGQEFIVLSGLKENEEVVASAHFLIDAESKLQAALLRGEKSSEGHSGRGK